MDSTEFNELFLFEICFNKFFSILFCGYFDIEEDDSDDESSEEIEGIDQDVYHSV